MVRKGSNGSAAPEEAWQALADTNSRIQKLSSEREGLLLANDDSAVDAIDVELTELERLARRDGDRVLLLELQSKRDEAERVAARRQALIGRVEKKLHESNAAALELQHHVEQADAAFRKIVKLRLECAAAWPWNTIDQNACVLTPAASGKGTVPVTRNATPSKFCTPLIALSTASLSGS
jgi:hypothetical protein